MSRRITSGQSSTSRRAFLKTSGTALAGTTVTPDAQGRYPVAMPGETKVL